MPTALISRRVILGNRFYPLHRYVRPDEIRTVTRLKPPQPRGPLSDPIRAGGGGFGGRRVCLAPARPAELLSVSLHDRRRRRQRMPVPPARRHRRTRPRCGVSLIQKGADRLINHRFTHFRDLLPSTASLAHQIATRRRRLSQIRPSPPMAPAVTRIHSGLIRVPRMRPAAAPVIAAACHPLSAARANT
jgi:hypothetical protein